MTEYGDTQAQEVSDMQTAIDEVIKEALGQISAADAELTDGTMSTSSSG